jgi:rubredoxin
MEREELSDHSRSCPVCQVTMIGKKFDSKQAVPDVFHCPNCGLILDFSHLPSGPNSN